MLIKPLTTVKASTLPFRTRDYYSITFHSSRQAWLILRKNGVKASRMTYSTSVRVETRRLIANSHTVHSEMTVAFSHTTLVTQTNKASDGVLVTELTSQES